MHAVSASTEYVFSTTDAAASGPMMESCTAGNATLPIAAIPDASPTSAVLIVSTSAAGDMADESDLLREALVADQDADELDESRSAGLDRVGDPSLHVDADSSGHKADHDSVGIDM